MAGGKGKSGKDSGKSKSKVISRSARAGLQFPVGRIHRFLKVKLIYSDKRLFFYFSNVPLRMDASVLRVRFTGGFCNMFESQYVRSKYVWSHKATSISNGSIKAKNVCSRVWTKFRTYSDRTYWGLNIL
jgi:hypothetical protein